MAISFTCTKCDQELEVEDQYAGAKAQCPGCNSVLSVPALGSATPPRAQKPSKRRVVEENDDDTGAEAETLDPYAAKRRAKRRRDEDDRDDTDPRSSRAKRLASRDQDDGENDRPRKRRSRRDNDDDDDADRATNDPRPKRKRKKMSDDEGYRFFNGQTIGGAVLMFIPIAIELACLACGFWFINVWMVIAFIAGLVTLIKGLLTGRNE